MTNKTYFWSEDEVKALQSAYKSSSGDLDSTALDRAVQSLPGKSRGCIAAKACRLGITTPRNRNQIIMDNCKPKPNTPVDQKVEILGLSRSDALDGLLDMFS